MLSEDRPHHTSFCDNCYFAGSCLAKEVLAQTNTLINKPIVLKPRQNLLHQNTSSKKLYIVKSGSLKQGSETQEGLEHVTDFYLPGEVIGLDTLSSNSPVENLTALETSQVCAVSVQEVQSLAKTRPQLQQKLFRLLSQKLSSRTKALLLQHHHAEQRLAAFLVDLSERFKKIGRFGLRFRLSMSRQEIGNYLHLSTETVSRLFSKLQNEQMLTVHKKQIELKEIRRLIAKSA